MIQQIKMSGQQQKQVKQQPDFLAQVQKTINLEPSPFLNAYHQFFQQYSIPDQPIQTISSTGLAYLKNQQSSQIFQISIIDHSLNFEIVKLRVRLGKFKIKIMLLNFQKTMSQIFPDCYNKNDNDEFNFNNVIVNEKLFFFKKFFIENQSKSQKIMIEAIREYCFLKIAEQLRVGPELTTGLRFDAYCFTDYFCFGMEMCENYLYSGKTTIQKDLMLNLKLLHSYHIVHFDIKPDNIAFSNKWAKFVFIDFGLTDCIQEDIGSLKMMSFRGSLEYCSPSFYNLYTNPNQNLVDPYYNDCHCLDASLSAIELEHKKKIGIRVDSEDPRFQDSRYQGPIENKKQIEHLIIKIKYELFQQNHELALQLMKFHQSIEIQKEIILFLHELPPSLSLRLVYQCISLSIRQALQFRLLTFAYKQLNAIPLSFSQVSTHKKKYNESKIGFLNHMKLIGTSNYKTIQNIKAMFETTKIVTSQLEIYFEGFLNCLDPTFNQYGLSLREKNEILSKFYQKFIKKEQEIILNPLEKFKKCTDFLLDALLKKPTTKWKMSRAFKIFNIAVLIDQYQLEQLLFYLNQLKRIFGTKQKQVMFLLQVSNIAYWLHFRVYSQKNICTANFTLGIEAIIKQTVDQDHFLLNETVKHCITLSKDLRQRILLERNIQKEEISRFKLQINNLQNMDGEYAKELIIVLMCAEIIFCSQNYNQPKTQLYNNVSALSKENYLFISPFFFLYDYQCQKQNIPVYKGIRKMFKLIVSFPQIYENYSIIYFQKLFQLQPIPSAVEQLKEQFWNRWHTRKWMVFNILVNFFWLKKQKEKQHTFLEHIQSVLLQCIQKGIEDSKKYLKALQYCSSELYLSIASKELLRVKQSDFQNLQHQEKYLQLHDEYIRVFPQIIKAFGKINQQELILDYLKHQFMNYIYHQQIEEAVQTLFKIKEGCSKMIGPIHEENMIFYLINTYSLELNKTSRPKQILLQIYNFSLLQEGHSIYSYRSQFSSIVPNTICIFLEQQEIEKAGQFIVNLCRKAFERQNKLFFIQLMGVFRNLWFKQFDQSYLILSQVLQSKWPSMQISEDCLLSLFYCSLNSKQVVRNSKLRDTFSMNEPFILNSMSHLPYEFQQNILYLYLSIKIPLIINNRKANYYKKLMSKTFRYFYYKPKSITLGKSTKTFPERQRQSLIKTIDNYIKCLADLSIY